MKIETIKSFIQKNKWTKKDLELHHKLEYIIDWNCSSNEEFIKIYDYIESTMLKQIEIDGYVYFTVKLNTRFKNRVIYRKEFLIFNNIPFSQIEKYVPEAKKEGLI